MQPQCLGGEVPFHTDVRGLIPNGQFEGILLLQTDSGWNTSEETKNGYNTCSWKIQKRSGYRQNNQKKVGKIRFEGIDLIKLAHETVQQQELVNTEMILQVLKRWDISLTDDQLSTSQNKLSL